MNRTAAVTLAVLAGVAAGVAIGFSEPATSAQRVIQATPNPDTFCDLCGLAVDTTAGAPVDGHSPGGWYGDVRYTYRSGQLVPSRYAHAVCRRADVDPALK